MIKPRVLITVVYSQADGSVFTKELTVNYKLKDVVELKTREGPLTWGHAPSTSRRPKFQKSPPPPFDTFEGKTRARRPPRPLPKVWRHWTRCSFSLDLFFFLLARAASASVRHGHKLTIRIWFSMRSLCTSMFCRRYVRIRKNTLHLCPTTQRAFMIRAFMLTSVLELLV